jgi:carboxypeptidase family protein
MRLRCFRFLGILFFLASTAITVSAQEFRGRLTGTVSDNSGAVLPGVTVTAASASLIQPQTTTTGVDGTYRFQALPAGVYELTFTLPGFRTVKRQDIRVVINQTLTVNADMAVASLSESVTVTGQSPVVDTSTTAVGTNFTRELLTEIPSARDIWASMAQAPGFQMTGYDVGGSHTGTQTGFMAYGIDDQRTTRIEGVNTTEGTGANAGYFDFGSFEELQLGAAGNMADHDTPGSSMNITVKAGGNKFKGTWYSDYQGKNLISDNVPDTFKTANQRDDNGFFVRKALLRGNQIDRQYDINFDVGGPIKRDKAWFFYSYRLDNQFKFVLNPDGSVFDTLAQSKLSNIFTIKATYQLTRNNQLIGFVNKREKLQALRDFGPGVPLSAAYYQSSVNYPMKGEWTSVLSDRAFLDVIVGQWLNFFPLRPMTEVGTIDEFTSPARIDISTSELMPGGPNTAYQDQRRHKPQFSASLSYFKDGWGGNHNFKLGSEARWEIRKFLADQPFDIAYYDARLGVTPQEVELFNTPNDGVNQVNAFAVFLNDNWQPHKKLTLNLGVRVDHYRDFYPDQTVKPNGIPALRSSTDPRLVAFFAERQIPGRTLARGTTIGPRIGFAYDFGGNGKSVVKAFFGQFSFNSAPDDIAAAANPVGRSRLRYRWTDLNQNLVIDSPAELGTFLRTIGSSATDIDPNLERPYGQEASVHFERELAAALSFRSSYVYKNIRNEWATVDVARVKAYTTPFTTTDPGPDGTRGTADDGGPIDLLDRTSVAEQRLFTNPDDPRYDSDFNTIEFAINRRFRGKWMFLTSYEYTWLKQFHGNTSSTSQTGAAGNAKSYDWRPNIIRFGRETSTIWNYKLLGRYVARFDIGVSGSYRLQSGRQWGRSISVTLPVAGAETIRVEPVTAHRAPDVGILDLRFDKSIRMAGHRLVGMVDVFNITNRGVPVTFRTASAVSFQEVTALLDPRIVRLAVRFEF